MEITIEITELIQRAANLCNIGSVDEAEEICRNVIDSYQDNARLNAILGVILCKKMQVTEGIVLLEKAVALQPDYAAAFANLGRACLEIGRLDEAMFYCHKALNINPGFLDAQIYLGLILRKTRNLNLAVVAFQKALSLDSGSISAHTNLVQVLHMLNKLDEAETLCRDAIDRNPSIPEIHLSLGNILAEKGAMKEAVDSFMASILLRQDYFEPRLSLGNLFLAQGKLSAAKEKYLEALTIQPESNVAHSNLLMSLNYDPSISDEQFFEEHLSWDRLHGVYQSKSSIAECLEQTPGNSILNIGYVSADFRKHPVGKFLIPVIESHDKKKFKIFCYNQGEKQDDFTFRFRQSAAIWREIADINDDTVERMIKEDGINILVDLSGHTSGNRLLVFARKPAPVQMTWAGYVGSTGLAAMDYLISDWRESPEGAERLCTEKIIRLPDGYVCFEPPVYAPPVDKLPALSNGYITFGCFNNLAKVNSQVIELWGRLLQHLPGSRIIMKTIVLRDGAVKKRYQELFCKAGVDPSRVDLLEGSPHRELLDTYNRIDIALDPFPYSGGLTTMEALWMGVPVVTLGGSRFCSRHSVSHLSNIGMPELIASGPDEYVAIATKLALDIERLSTLRSGLRRQVATSPLCDGERFTKNLEEAFEKAWTLYQEKAALC